MTEEEDQISSPDAYEPRLPGPKKIKVRAKVRVNVHDVERDRPLGRFSSGQWWAIAIIFSVLAIWAFALLDLFV